MPAAHFWNRRRWDALAEYAELGMDYVVVPRETSWRNILTLTRYAVPRQTVRVAPKSLSIALKSIPTQSTAPTMYPKDQAGWLRASR